MPQWYYVQDGQRSGPVSLEELVALVRSGKVRTSDAAWTQGMAQWEAIGKIPELAAAIGAAGGPALKAGFSRGAADGGPGVPPEFMEYLKFKKFITPAIIQVLFWIGVALCVLSGIGIIVSGIHFGAGAVIAGLLELFLGPLFVRLYCELLMVMFSIDGTLKDIKNKMRDKIE
jgi:hypothetical protein